MKSIFTLLLVVFTGSTFAQSTFPSFLEGTWKAEDKEIYEHWDKLNDNMLKGFGYKIKDKQWQVSEYLDISQNKKQIFYTATVTTQNQGKSIPFKLTVSDSKNFTFENPKHDFPKKIVYQKLSDTEFLVQVSGDASQRSFSYKMKKQNIKSTEKDSINPNYDANLAKRLGADAYGMKGYIFVVLKTGSNQTTDKALISEKFKGHMENMNKLVEQKKLVVAGPFGKNNNNYRGLFILSDVKTLDEAKELLQTDPAIKAGLLDVEVYYWYGSAALSEYLDSADKVWKSKP